MMYRFFLFLTQDKMAGGGSESLQLMSTETFGTEEITEKTRREETPGIILLLHRKCRLSIKFETE